MEETAIPNSPETPSAAQASTPASVPIRVQASDLPLSCPRPGDALWNMHPRVYLPIDEAPDRKAVCPYCGAVYELVGEIGKSH